MKIKNILLAVLLLVTISQANTLLSKNTNMTGFGGPILQINDGNIAFGGGGSILLNDWLFIGGQGFGGRHNDYVSGYGGMVFGAIINSKSSIFNPYVSALVGRGGSIKRGVDFKNIDKEKISFNIINLNIGAQVKITKWFRITPTLGYRFIMSSTEEVMKGGLFYDVNFQFGFIKKDKIWMKKHFK